MQLCPHHLRRALGQLVFSKAGALEHLYGAHYDLDESGHPVFHAQVAPKIGMVSHSELESMAIWLGLADLAMRHP